MSGTDIQGMDLQGMNMEKKMEYWQIFSAVRTGEGHEAKGMLCQDRVCFKQKDGLQIIALADGIGNCDLNVIGTERVLDSLCSFFLKDYDEIMSCSEEEIRYASLFEVRDVIGSAAEEYSVSADTFSSTILVVCINLNDQSYCSIHLGDGAVLYRKEGEYQVLSYPANGIGKNQTYLTTSSNILQEIRVFRGSLERIEGFVLISDGVYGEADDSGKLGFRVEDIFQKGMVSRAAKDDQGIIGFVRRAGKDICV